MEIHNKKNVMPVRAEQVTKNNNKENSNKAIQKSSEKSSLELNGVYNIAFAGLFPKKEYIDATKRITLLQMRPNKKYIISDDAVFMVGKHAIDLKSPEIKKYIDNITPEQELFFGKDSFGNYDESDKNLSTKHLIIKRDSNGQLTAETAQSKYPAVLLPNIIKPNLTNAPISFPPHLKFFIPLNSVLQIGKENLELNKYRDILYNSNKRLIVGRNENADIIINDSTVSRNHCAIEKYMNGIIIEDLGSTNGTKFISLQKPNYESNYQNITDITPLKRYVPTLLPKNSQLYLGNNFTIDIRNPNIRELLDTKGTIYVGRDTYNDIQVPNTYASVSRTHLCLQQSGDDVIATNISEKNTVDVIPQNKIQPFYNGLKDIFLAQSNIGDCFLLSTIYAMSRTALGQQLIQNMVTIDDKGNYWVKFYNNEPIKVKPEELDGQKNQDSEKISVSGDLGIKAIERAYAKMIKNPLRSFEKGGHTMFLDIDDGGYTDITLKKMTGIVSKRYNPMKTNLSEVFKKIKNNGVNNYILTCSTYNKGNYDKYMDPQHRFPAKHAYAVYDIDTKNQTLKVVNPHYTKYIYELSWAEFSEYFDMFCAAPVKKGIEL